MMKNIIIRAREKCDTIFQVDDNDMLSKISHLFDTDCIIN